MPVGKKVVIIGGDTQGCGLAEFCVKRGRGVTIVDTTETLGESVPLVNRVSLIPWLAQKGVEMMTGVKFEEITDKGLTITTREGKKKTLEADTIVVALPLLPDTNTIKSLEGKAGETYMIGDSREPQMMPQAVADGARIGFMI